MGSRIIQQESNRSTRLGRMLWLAAAVLAGVLAIVGVTCAEEGNGAIEGVVLEAGTRQPIPSANILLPGTQRGAASDLEGRFRVAHVPPGTWTIEVSALGYATRTLHEITVTPSRTPSITILLEPSAVKGEEVTYTVRSWASSTPDLPTSARNLRYEEVRRAPGGLEDVQRTVQALPGVVNSNDSDNAIVVRGGAPDENLTVIDGIEIENTNHLTFGNDVKGNGGPINGLDTEFLQDVTFASGGFSAKYGDKMSSLLDLELREGSRERFGGAADLNMAGAGGYVEGPIQRERGSFLVSAHKAYLELLPKESIGVASWPDYWHTQAKLTWDLTPRQKLTVDGLYLEDRVENPYDPDEAPNLADAIDALTLNTERSMLGGRLRSLWGSGYTDLVLAHTEAYAHWNVFEARHPGTADPGLVLASQQRRRVRQDQLSVSWSGEGFRRDRWATGVQAKPLHYTNHTFLRGDSLVYEDGTLGGPEDGQPDVFHYPDREQHVDEKGLKYAAFLQYTWRPVATLDLTGGVRDDGFDYANQTLLQPRLSLHWQFFDGWALNAAWGLYGQSHDPAVYMDTDGRRFNRGLPYSRARQSIAGITFQPRSSTLLSVEGYIKDYDHLLVREQDVVRQRTGDRRFTSDRYLATGTREAWGLEFFAQQKLVTDWYGTLSYSYGHATQDDAAFGSYPADFDYRHVATAVLGYTTCLITQKGYRDFLAKPWGWWLWALPLNGDQVTFASRYRFMSGRPYTRQVWYPEGAPSPEPLYQGHWEEQGHNNARYPDYSRWDIRVDSKYYYGTSALIWYVELQNVDDHPNVAEFQYLDNGRRSTVYQFRQTWVLGVRYEF